MVMVPDEGYRSSSMDAHVTVADFGQAAELANWEREIMLSVAKQVAAFKTYYQKRPKVTGRGVFHLDPQYSDGNTYAYVDLIDWNVFPTVREMVEQKLGITINRTHGFIPHMTVGYGNMWIPDLARPNGQYTFGWDSVQIWLGDERIRFPIEY
jgi:hypothetical protein